MKYLILVSSGDEEIVYDLDKIPESVKLVVL